jgi:EAL domain-containing protein (putative c-di-GMP-specific phosphodiesterase class I)
VGIYELEGDDLRIEYQNPAAIANLGRDLTGMLLGEALPSHKDPFGASFGDNPEATLLDTYLSVARTGIPWQGDLCYLADGVEGWYRTRVGIVAPGIVLITWSDVSAEKVSIENQAMYLKVQRGLVAKEFVLHYQPIISLSTGEVAGFEALVRWPREDGSMRYPGEFLPSIKETDLITQLSWYIAQIACDELVRWKDEGIHKGCYLAINVPPFTIESEGFDSKIYGILDKHVGSIHDLLMVEVTEEGNDLTTELLARLRRLRQTGVLVGIDDFGTGNTSLITLHRMQWATLIKLDQGFITDILEDEGAQKFVRSIVALAQELNMNVAAEGIESAEVADWCRDAGINYGQGWYWSKAVASP